jgi:hypothetical protein
LPFFVVAKNPYEADYDKSVFIRSLIRQTGIQTPASLKYVDAYEKTKKQRANPKIKETLTTIFELFYKQDKRPPLSMVDIHNTKAATKNKDLKLNDTPQTQPLTAEIQKNVQPPLEGAFPSLDTAVTGYDSKPLDLNLDDKTAPTTSGHFSFDDEESQKINTPKMTESDTRKTESDTRKNVLAKLDKIQQELSDVRQTLIAG